MARTILVTGGAGYIGSHVVKALQEARRALERYVVVQRQLHRRADDESYEAAIVVLPNRVTRTLAC